MDYDITHPRELIRVFDGPCEFADYLEKIPDCYWRNDSVRRDYKADYRKGINMLRQGDLDIARQAEDLVKQFEDAHVLSVGMPQPTNAVIGAQTIMPLYEAGIPDCMLTLDQSHLKGVNTPLNIYFDRYGSMGLDSQQALNRGLACIAFVIAMSQIRPINLYVISATTPEDWGLFGGLVRVHTSPLDLARAGWMMTSKIFYETVTWTHMSYQYHRHHKFNRRTQGYEVAIGPYGGCIQRTDLAYGYRRSFDCAPDDIILYGTQTTAPRVHDQSAADNPIGWIKAMLKLHSEREE